MTLDRNWLDYSTFGVGVIVLIVGVFGVRYAKRTLDAIADQATTLHEHAEHFESLSAATNRQADIQEASMSQWVEAAFCGITTHELTKVPNSNAIETAEISVQGKIVNRTPLPLTVDKVVTKISRTENWETFEVVADELLAPANPQLEAGYESGYAFYVLLALDKEQAARLLQGELRFAFVIEVSFIEASGTARRQSFPGIVGCNTHTITNLPYLGVKLQSSEREK